MREESSNRPLITQSGLKARGDSRLGAGQAGPTGLLGTEPRPRRRGAHEPASGLASRESRTR